MLKYIQTKPSNSEAEVRKPARDLPPCPRSPDPGSRTPSPDPSPDSTETVGQPIKEKVDFDGFKINPNATYFESHSISSGALQEPEISTLTESPPPPEDLESPRESPRTPTNDESPQETSEEVLEEAFHELKRGATPEKTLEETPYDEPKEDAAPEDGIPSGTLPDIEMNTENASSSVFL